MALYIITNKGKGKSSEQDVPKWLTLLLEKQEETRLQQEEAREKRHQEEMEAMRQLLANQQNQAQVSSSSSNNHGDRNNSERNEKIPNLPRPPTLQADASYTKFVEWREGWNDYSTVIHLDQQTPETQRAHLRSCMSTDMRLHMKCAMGIDRDEDTTTDDILDRIQSHLRQKRNITLDRVDFTERRQEEAETFDNFYVAVKKLAEEADLCKNCVEQRITTRIISGIKSQELRQKLLALNPFPQLQTVVDMCRSYESSIKDCALISRKSVNKISNYKKNFKESNFTKSNKYKAKDERRTHDDKCNYCGGREHEKSKCPAKDSTCNHCNKRGHWSSVCFHKKQNEKETSVKNTGRVHYLRSTKDNNSDTSTPRVSATFIYNKEGSMHP